MSNSVEMFPISSGSFMQLLIRELRCSRSPNENKGIGTTDIFSFQNLCCNLWLIKCPYTGDVYTKEKLEILQNSLQGSQGSERRAALASTYRFLYFIYISIQLHQPDKKITRGGLFCSILDLERFLRPAKECT